MKLLNILQIFLYAFTSLQSLVCVKLHITRLKEQDLYKGFLSCTSLSFQSGDGCQCNYGINTFYGNKEKNKELGCYKKDDILTETGCTSFDFIDNTSIKTIPSCDENILQSLYIWNYNESQTQGIWEEINDKSFISDTFKVQNNTIELITDRSKLAGVLFKVTLKCQASLAESCTLYVIKGTALYPLNVEDLTKKTSTPTAYTPTLTATIITEPNTGSQQTNNTTALTAFTAPGSEPETWVLVHASVFGIILIIGIIAIIYVYKSKIGRKLRSTKIQNKSISHSKEQYTRPKSAKSKDYPKQEQEDDEDEEDDTGEYIELEEQFANNNPYYKSLTFPSSKEANMYHVPHRSYTLPNKDMLRHNNPSNTNTSFQNDIRQPNTYQVLNIKDNTVQQNTYHSLRTNQTENKHSNTYQMPNLNESKHQEEQQHQQQYHIIEPEYKEIIEVNYETIQTMQNYVAIDGE